MNVNCVVTDYVEPDLEWEAEQYHGNAVDFLALQLRNAPARKIVETVRNASVLVVDQARITREVIEGLPQCKLIIRHGDGYDNLDLEAATRAGIVCANKPGFWSQEVAEQAFALALSLLLRIPSQQSIAATGGSDAGWDLSLAKPQRRLSGLTAGIVGFGKIGRRAAPLFRAVFSKVLVVDPFVAQTEISSAGFTPVELEELLATSDIVSVHVPATPETVRMICGSSIAAMKPGAALVNTSRGPIVETNALVSALQSGALGGAALDVTDPEPLPPNHPLMGMPNVIVTPHMCWYSEDAMWAMRRSIVEDVLNFRSGRLPTSVVNPAVLKSPVLRKPVEHCSWSKR
jgi:D-3-phosphoglycerate dehydrogenase / 2-oxoglutarate reductase